VIILTRPAGAGKSFLTCDFLYSDLADNLRSLAIDYLLGPSVSVMPLYIFFDYKDDQNQTAEKVIANLLRQLISSIQIIPSDLETEYDRVKNGSPRPVLSAFINLFIKYAKSASFIVLFDAFDECKQQGVILSQLVRQMYNSGIKVFITHRPHVLQNPKADFNECTVMEIRARREDVQNYTAQQLDMEEKTKHLAETFKDTIIKEISAQANDM
jgi:hypothetical protein